MTIFTWPTIVLAGVLSNSVVEAHDRLDTLSGWMMDRHEAVGSQVRDVPRVRLIWRLGGIDVPEEEMFQRVTGVSVSPTGEVHALDFGLQSIRVFSSDGRFIRTIGRSGQGPGEFDSAISMAWGPDTTLWVADAFNARYHVFDAEGAYLRALPRPFSSVRGWSQFLRFDESGAIIDEVPVASPPATAIVRMVPGTDRFDTLHVFPRDVPPPPDLTPAQTARLSAAMREIGGSFTPRSIFVMGSAGTLWLGRTNSGRVQEWSANGRLLRTVGNDDEPLGLTREQNSLLRDALRGTGVSPEDLGLGRQAIQGIFPLEDGHLLIQRPSETGDPGREVDVWSPEGELLGSVILPDPPIPDTVPSIDGNTITYVARGELGVQLLVRVQLEWGRGAP